MNAIHTKLCVLLFTGIVSFWFCDEISADCNITPLRKCEKILESVHKVETFNSDMKRNKYSDRHNTSLLVLSTITYKETNHYFCEDREHSEFALLQRVFHELGLIA